MSLPTFTRVIPTEPTIRPFQGGGLRPSVPENQKRIIAEAIRSARKAKRLSQFKVGKLAGISKKLVCQYENARCLPAVQSLFALAVVLELDLNELAKQFKSESEAQIKG